MPLLPRSPMRATTVPSSLPRVSRALIEFLVCMPEGMRAAIDTRWASELNEPNFVPAGSPSYLESVVAEAKKWRPRLTDSQKGLVDQFVGSMEGDMGDIAVIRGYMAHWQLRDSQKKAFESQCRSVAEGSVLLHWDFEEHPTRINYMRDAWGEMAIY